MSADEHSLAPATAAIQGRLWLRDLTGKERKTLGAAVAGWALDAMDVQIYSFVIPTLISVWGMTRGEAGFIGTAALVSSAIGGWLAGWLADKYGRVLVLQISILWFAVFTFLCGLAQNAEQLLVYRALMGLGFGGEWAAGSVLLGEIIRAQHRGKALGLMQAGWALGWGCAALLATLFFSILDPQVAWRALFFVGVVPGLLVFFIRRFIGDSEVYLRSRNAPTAKVKVDFLAIFRPPLLRITLLGGLLGTGAQGGYNALTTWLPTFLRTERGLSILDSSGYLAVLIIGSFFGYITGGYISDHIGRRSTFLVFGVGAALAIVLYAAVPFGNTAMLLLGAPLGFFGAGVFSCMGAFYTEQFPTSVRGVGQGFAYNLGRGIGAFFPALVGYMSGTMGLGLALGTFGLIAYALMIIAAFLLPETKGKVLVD